jgi:uncharacterized iron-regulated membrane protein
MLYILFVSVTGCALLFEPELYAFFSPRPVVASQQGDLLANDQLRRAAADQYPRARVVDIWMKKLSTGSVAEVWLETDDGISRRLFHPYTGADLGDADPVALRLLASLRSAHRQLMGGSVGRAFSAAGALALFALAITGVIARRPRKPVPPELRSKRQLFSFHRTMGIWCAIFAAMWGLTGASLAAPGLVAALFSASSQTQSVFAWLYAVHAGTLAGWPLRSIWAIAALATAALAVSGMIMWGRRFKRPRAARPSARAAALAIVFVPRVRSLP